VGIHRARPLAASLAALLATALMAACAGAGTGGPRALTLRPEQLRRQLEERIPPAEVVVPFEISAEHARKARDLTAFAADGSEKVKILVEAMFNPQELGLHYRQGVAGSAEDAFRNGGGDCLALASVFVGLARAAGLEAAYMDASFRMQETEVLSEQTTVKVGHITAFVRLGNDRIGLDFARLGRIYYYQPIEDVAAVAHYYNNLGYILLEAGGAGESTESRAAAAHQFRLATLVKPDFARAWNNLGVVEARRGKRDQARIAYRRAISADPEFPSPRLNLGALLLEAGELDAALEQLEAAGRLDPSAANVQYELGLARLRHGNRKGAVRALERAISLRGGFPAAQALLDQLEQGTASTRPPGEEG
jgi:tetratricopeptide (TPR) repeat protein